MNLFNLSLLISLVGMIPTLYAKPTDSGMKSIDHISGRVSKVNSIECSATWNFVFYAGTL